MINYDNELFNIDIPGGKPSVGSLLVSEPFLKEEYFHHAVISVIDYAPYAEAMGVVMNRMTTFTLQGLIDRISVETPIPIFCGGPMSCDRIFYLHSLGEIIPDSQPVAEGLFVGGSFDAIIDYVNAGYPVEGYLRFFVGYSGWSPRQLDEEIANRVWAVTPADSPARLLTGCEDSYWHYHVRRLGNRFKGWRYHPSNPHVN